MTRPIDLRSDTVTKPTAAMRAAMASAEVGDDVYGEDPTVNALEERIADMLGHEAALFTPSGVMANQLAIKAHTQPGEEIIVEQEGHVFLYETGAPAVLSNVLVHTIPGTKGILAASDIEATIRPDVYYLPRTGLICLENTHNKAGGTIYPLETMREIRVVSTAHHIPLHLDGARLWNASVATGIPVGAYGRLCDSVAVCFSKGLGAPVGSALAGSRETIRKARKWRKVIGGGMRQAGILAAAALHALDHHVARLAEDHANARFFAESMATIKGCRIDLASVQTNIVIADVREMGMRARDVVARAKDGGVLLSEMSEYAVRAVFHMDVARPEVERAAALVAGMFR